MTRLIKTLAAGLVLAAAGCGGTADLAGTVTFNGKPVVWGTVTVIGADGLPKSGAIQPDGKYTVTGVVAGAVKVMVSSPPPPGAKAGRLAGKGREAVEERPRDDDPAVPPEVLKNWVPLPEMYSVPESTDLKTTLTGGANTFNIDLK